MNATRAAALSGYRTEPSGDLRENLRDRTEEPMRFRPDLRVVYRAGGRVATPAAPPIAAAPAAPSVRRGPALRRCAPRHPPLRYRPLRGRALDGRPAAADQARADRGRGHGRAPGGRTVAGHRRGGPGDRPFRIAADDRPQPRPGGRPSRPVPLVSGRECRSQLRSAPGDPADHSAKRADQRHPHGRPAAVGPARLRSAPRDTPAGGSEVPQPPGFPHQLRARACLRPPPWSTVTTTSSTYIVVFFPQVVFTD